MVRYHHAKLTFWEGLQLIATQEIELLESRALPNSCNSDKLVPKALRASGCVMHLWQGLQVHWNSVDVGTLGDIHITDGPNT